MARAIWSGSISFGLVNVPVKVFTAVREHAVHFHQVEKGTGARIRYEKVSDKSGKEVAGEDIELGYEVSNGTLVTLEAGQLEQLKPRTTRAIEITDYVDLVDIDPVFFARTYWLAPDGDGAKRAYELLVAAMEDRGRAGIGTVVMRNKQYLAAIRPRDGALALSTMHFGDEVLAKSEVDGIPSRATNPAANEMKLATQIIDSLSGKWDPTRYKDTYTEEVKTLIERQAKGEKVVVDEESSGKDGKVLDLMAALEASLDAASKGKGAKKPPSKSRAKKASARKSA